MHVHLSGLRWGCSTGSSQARDSVGLALVDSPSLRYDLEARRSDHQTPDKMRESQKVRYVTRSGYTRTPLQPKFVCAAIRALFKNRQTTKAAATF